MRLWARLIALIPSISTLLARSRRVEEFGRAIFAQLDFRIEAEQQPPLPRATSTATPTSCSPRSSTPCSSERVLTMSFIDGTKILVDARDALAIRSGSRASGCATLLKMIFEDGFVHADLHPGNIFITPDDKLALLDLGLVGELDDPHRKGFARLFAAWAQRDGDGWRASCTNCRRSADPAATAERFDACAPRSSSSSAATGAQRLGDVQVGARPARPARASCAATACA